MVSTQALKLLDALLAGSSGSETKKLQELYREAYCGTACFKDLKTLLERSEFHGTTGQELLRQSEEVIQAGFTSAGSFGDSVTVMEYLVEKINEERKNTEEYIRSTRVSGVSLNVIDKRLADQATEYYEKLLQYVCCLYASLYGDAILKNFNVKRGIRSGALIRNLDDELTILLAEARRMPKPRAWRILRRTFGGLNVLRYEGFVMEYGNVTMDYLKNQCRQISPTLYVPTEDSDVLCCGIGYLTSLGTADGASIFGTHVTTNPAMNCLDSQEMDYRHLNVSELLSKLAGGSVCIVKPEDVVEILNRYFMIKTAQKNQQTGCVLCGSNHCRHYSLNRSFSEELKVPQVPTL